MLELECFDDEDEEDFSSLRRDESGFELDLPLLLLLLLLSLLLLFSLSRPLSLSLSRSLLSLEWSLDLLLTAGEEGRDDLDSADDEDCCFDSIACN